MLCTKNKLNPIRNKPGGVILPLLKKPILNRVKTKFQSSSIHARKTWFS